MMPTKNNNNTYANGGEYIVQESWRDPRYWIATFSNNIAWSKLTSTQKE